MIRVKILDILEKKERNLRWLSQKANINYSTLYNFAHGKTSSVKLEVLDNLCEFLDCKLSDIIEYTKKQKNNP